jgi:hypothetical protein
LQELFGMTLWDTALYKHAEALMDTDMAEMYEPAYSLANEMCTHACCLRECGYEVYNEDHQRIAELDQSHLKGPPVLPEVRCSLNAPCLSRECCVRVSWMFPGC